MLEKYIDEIQEQLNNININIPNARVFRNELEETLVVARKFKELYNDVKGCTLTKSPYSDSFYLFPKGSKIDWGSKPEGSYRFSNHWNWGEENEYTGIKTVHCPTNTGEDFGIAIAVVENGKYKRIY